MVTRVCRKDYFDILKCFAYEEIKAKYGRLIVVER